MFRHLYYQYLSRKIQRRIKELRKFSDARLKAQTALLRGKLAQGKSLNSLLVEAYATVCEADRRVLGLSPYPVQIGGGGFTLW